MASAGVSSEAACMGRTPVSVDTFVRAETERMFATLVDIVGGVNRWNHVRRPTPLNEQSVIRMNRDTIYSGAVVDIRDGATLTLPDVGPRYLSAMVIGEDHHIEAVLHEPGEHSLSPEVHRSDYVMVGVRVLVDPTSEDDVEAVNAIQDELVVTAASAVPFERTDYEPTSFDATRDALLELARGLPDFRGAFGGRDDVDPVRHLVGTASAWGGLPETEAMYLNVDPGLPVGSYRLRVPADVPVDGFWSISLYDSRGYFPDTGQRVNVSSLTADRDDDGSVTVRLGGDDGPNHIPLVDGWNYMVRLYRPRPEVLDGSWSFPTLVDD
jgi:hypothetical protein